MNNNVLKGSVNNGKVISEAELLAAAKLMMSTAVSVRKMPPVGNYTATFKGITLETQPVRFVIRFMINEVEYAHDIKMTAEENKQFMFTLGDILAQFGMPTGSAEDANKHIDEDIQVQVVKAPRKDGTMGTFYNYKELAELNEVAATSAPSDGKDF